MQEAEQSRQKERVGRVVSDKMDKTIVVAIEEFHTHALYGRRLRRTKRLKAHNEQNEAKLGDLVRIVETRPLSREKRWRLVEILERARV